MLLKKFTIFLFYSVVCIQVNFAQSNNITISSKDKIVKIAGKQIEFEVKEKAVSKKKLFCGNKEYYWYKSQTIINTKGAASGHLLHGVYEVFYDNQQFAERGKFINGLKHGKWYYWNEKGEKIKSEFWFFGKSLTDKKNSNNESNTESKQ